MTKRTTPRGRRPWTRRALRLIFSRNGLPRSVNDQSIEIEMAFEDFLRHERWSSTEEGERAGRLGAIIVGDVRLMRKWRKRAMADARRNRPKPRPRVLRDGYDRPMCVICGGQIAPAHNDGVVEKSTDAGAHSPLGGPTHPTCRRGEYSPGEFEFFIHVGRWARGEIDRGTELGLQIAAQFAADEYAPKSQGITGGHCPASSE